MNDLNYFEKIVSGSASYCAKVMKEYTQRGYSLIKWTAHPDGKYTYILRKDK